MLPALPFSVCGRCYPIRLQAQSLACEVSRVPEKRAQHIGKRDGCLANRVSASSSQWSSLNLVLYRVSPIILNAYIRHRLHSCDALDGENRYIPEFQVTGQRGEHADSSTGRLPSP